MSLSPHPLVAALLARRHVLAVLACAAVLALAMLLSTTGSARVGSAAAVSTGSIGDADSAASPFSTAAPPSPSSSLSSSSSAGASSSPRGRVSAARARAQYRALQPPARAPALPSPRFTLSGELQRGALSFSERDEAVAALSLAAVPQRPLRPPRPAGGPATKPALSQAQARLKSKTQKQQRQQQQAEVDAELTLDDLSLPAWSARFSPLRPDVLDVHARLQPEGGGGSGKMLVVVPFRESLLPAESADPATGRRIRRRGARGEQLLQLLARLDAHLRAAGKQPGRDYAVLVVEQGRDRAADLSGHSSGHGGGYGSESEGEDGGESAAAFNKAQLINAGARLAREWGYGYIVAHDVDVYPTSPQNTYDLPPDGLPLHMASAIARHHDDGDDTGDGNDGDSHSDGNESSNRKRAAKAAAAADDADYEASWLTGAGDSDGDAAHADDGVAADARGMALGGVWAASLQHFFAVNGLPNALWGRGGAEDAARLAFHRTTGFRRLNATAGRYRRLPRVRDEASAGAAGALLAANNRRRLAADALDLSVDGTAALRRAPDGAAELNATVTAYAPLPALGPVHWVTVRLEPARYRPGPDGVEPRSLQRARLEGALPPLAALGLDELGRVRLERPLTRSDLAWLERLRAFELWFHRSRATTLYPANSLWNSA